MIIASELQALLGVDVMPIFEILFGQMAASCATMAAALRDAACGNQVTSHAALMASMHEKQITQCLALVFCVLQPSTMHKLSCSFYCCESALSYTAMGEQFWKLFTLGVL